MILLSWFGLSDGSWPLVDANDSFSLLQLVRWFMIFGGC